MCGLEPKRGQLISTESSRRVDLLGGSSTNCGNKRSAKIQFVTTTCLGIPETLQHIRSCKIDLVGAVASAALLA